MTTQWQRCVIGGAWIATIALAYVGGRRAAEDAMPSTASGPAEDRHAPIGRISSPAPTPAPSRLPAAVLAVDADVLPVGKDRDRPASPRDEDIGAMLDDLEAIGAGLDDEERDRLLHHLAGALTDFYPPIALQWAASLEESEALRLQLTADILARWSQTDPEAAMQALDNLVDPQVRASTINAMATALAMTGTERAVTWADTLPTQAEQDAAHAAIYDATPRGIGAVLNVLDGAVQIDRLLPDGVAARSGLIRNGDRIVAVDSGAGAFQDLSGLSLEDAVGLIRGENGAPLRLRIMRETDAGPQTLIVPLTRDQVIIPEQE